LILDVLLRTQPIAHTRMTRDQLFPIHRQDLLDRALRLERIEINHAAARDLSDRREVGLDSLLRQPHDDVLSE
jgi:hypothetical protein